MTSPSTNSQETQSSTLHLELFKDHRELQRKIILGVSERSWQRERCSESYWVNMNITLLPPSKVSFSNILFGGHTQQYLEPLLVLCFRVNPCHSLGIMQCQSWNLGLLYMQDTYWAIFLDILSSWADNAMIITSLTAKAGRGLFDPRHFLIL